MTDLADDFMARREAKLAELGRLIVEKEKQLAALEGECNVARSAMNELGSQRVELQNAVNANRALLSKSQADLANVQAMFQALRQKVQSLPIRATG